MPIGGALRLSRCNLLWDKVARSIAGSPGNIGPPIPVDRHSYDLAASISMRSNYFPSR